MKDDEYYMTKALDMAKKAFEIGEVPVGAVIVKNGEIISFGYNKREREKNPLCHAEIIAIEEAANKLGKWRLLGCTIYVTLEPCPMCTGAIINSRIDRVVYGAKDLKAGCLGSKVNLNERGFNHQFYITSGILKDDCSKILSDFFKNIRKEGENEK
ncbi:MAG: tRNA adenosine(34) deaminase TadA [Oscillospiraceae bacterium]